MGQMVWTAIGMVDIDLLDVFPAMEFGDNYAKAVIRYHLKQDLGPHPKGMLVKASAHVDGLRPIAESQQDGVKLVQGKLNG